MKLVAKAIRKYCRLKIRIGESKIQIFTQLIMARSR